MGEPVGGVSLKEYVDKSVVLRLRGNFSLTGVLRYCTGVGRWHYHIGETDTLSWDADGHFATSRPHGFDVVEVEVPNALDGAHTAERSEGKQDPIHAAFEALEGQRVVVRTRGGAVVVDTLEKVDARPNLYPWRLKGLGLTWANAGGVNYVRDQHPRDLVSVEKWEPGVAYDKPVLSRSTMFRPGWRTHTVTLSLRSGASVTGVLSSTDVSLVGRRWHLADVPGLVVSWDDNGRVTEAPHPMDVVGAQLAEPW